MLPSLLTPALVVALTAFVDAAQVPLIGSSFPQWAVPEQPWNLDNKPSPNTTDNLVFDSVASLLQHWPNTRYRNGHAIVPGKVPVGTLLYHGATTNIVPAVPEWVATDPEHSYLFAMGRKECWHLTLVTTRALNVLYFDGSSAAKMNGGPMDSQDIVAWGRVIPEKIFAERERINVLCAWGKKFGIDGFFRMEMDFEIMLCDFTAGVQVQSFLNLTSAPPGQPPISPPPHDPYPGTPPSPPHNPPSPPHVLTHPVQNFEGRMRSFEVIHSGSWHNTHPGDPRVVLDYTRFLSFYDTSLVPSLVGARIGKRRGEYRLNRLSQDHSRTFMIALEGVLSFSGRVHVGSGVDWNAQVHVITKRYTHRLQLVSDFLSGSFNSGDPPAVIALKVFTQLRVILTPYTLASAVPTNNTALTNLEWAEPVYRLCSSTPTSFISSTPAVMDSLTYSERLILTSIEGTNREICRVLVGMWARGMQAKVPFAPDDFDVAVARAGWDVGGGKAVSTLLRTWKEEIDGLMQWLGWTAWVRCKPACTSEEMCYLPTWPHVGRRGQPPL